MMKRIFAALCALMVLTTACGGGNGGSSAPAAPTLKEGVTLSSLMEELGTEYEISMPAAVDEQILKDMLGISAEDVEEYAGSISMVMISADNLIGVKAKDGKLETVQKGLEDRLEFVRQSFERYLPDQKEKAAAGKVVTVGDYAFLIIAGRMDKDPAAEVAEIEQKINDSFVTK